MNRPCLSCGVPCEGRFCPTCLPSSHRYRSWRWDKLSARMRRLSGCCVCGTKVGTAVHHKVPLSRGGHEYDPANLEVRCEHHHAEAHGKIRG